MGQRSAEVLAEQAFGPVNPAELTETKKSGFLSSSTLLYDQPIIEYINKEETLICLLTNEDAGFITQPPDGSNQESDDDLDGKYYLLITDDRILYVAGRSDGDKTVEIKYPDIKGVTADTSDGLAVVNIVLQDETVYGFLPAGLDNQVVESMSQHVYGYASGQIEFDKNSSGELEPTITDEAESDTDSDYKFRFTSEVLSPSVDYGEHRINIDKSGISFENNEYRITFDEIGKVQDFDHWCYGQDPLGIPYNGIKLIDDNCDDHYIYRSGEGKEDISEEIITYIQQRVEESSDVELPYAYSLCTSRVLKRPNLKVEGWTDGSSSIEATVDGSTSSEGKSKGVEVGPFTRSKTSSSSSISGDISGNISDNSYTAEVREFKLYDEHLSIDSDLELDIDYSDIDRVFRKNNKSEGIYDDQGGIEGVRFVGDGIALQVDSTSFIIENLPDSAPIDDAIEFIRSNMTEDKEETKADSSNDKAPTEKIRELKSLHEEGILTDEEFESKKEELLDDF